LDEIQKLAQEREKLKEVYLDIKNTFKTSKETILPLLHLAEILTELEEVSADLNHPVSIQQELEHSKKLLSKAQDNLIESTKIISSLSEARQQSYVVKY
jgi:hypothetical protein